MINELCQTLAKALSPPDGGGAFPGALLSGDCERMRALTLQTNRDLLLSWSEQAMTLLHELYRQKRVPFCQLTAAAQAAFALRAGSAPSPPVACVGSIRGDPSATSKNFIKMLLCARGLPALDLGVDVDPPVFLEAVRRSSLRYVVCSVFMPSAADGVAAIDMLAKRQGIRKRFFLVAAGCALDEPALKACGVDWLETDTALVAQQVITWHKK